jgi:DNA-binding NarL/FixJ family response regulator
MFSSSTEEGGIIKIIIADDHNLFRKGLRKLLQSISGIEVVGEASNGEECLSLAKKLKPDVILIDLSMPYMEDFEVIKKLKRLLNLKVVALSMHSEKNYVVKAVKSGCDGYVLKNSPLDELIQAIQAVLREGAFFSPQVARYLADTLVEKEEEILTPREKEILKLLAQGKRNKEIAAELFISEKTVKNHLANIYAKLNVGDRVEAAFTALKMGLVDRNELGGKE